MPRPRAREESIDVPKPSIAHGVGFHEQLMFCIGKDSERAVRKAGRSLVMDYRIDEKLSSCAADQQRCCDRFQKTRSLKTAC